MKKNIIVFFFILISLASKAQNYGAMNAILEKLEQRKKQNKNPVEFNEQMKQFVCIKEFDDHTERLVIEFKGNTITFIEMFDDKKDNSTTSNVFTGDYKRHKNIISVRADQLEGKKIGIPITFTFVINQQQGIWYLINANKKDERWIEAKSLTR